MNGPNNSLSGNSSGKYAQMKVKNISGKAAKVNINACRYYCINREKRYESTESRFWKAYGCADEKYIKTTSDVTKNYKLKPTGSVKISPYYYSKDHIRYDAYRCWLTRSDALKIYNILDQILDDYEDGKINNAENREVGKALSAGVAFIIATFVYDNTNSIDTRMKKLKGIAKQLRICGGKYTNSNGIVSFDNEIKITLAIDVNNYESKRKIDYSYKIFIDKITYNKTSYGATNWTYAYGPNGMSGQYMTKKEFINKTNIVS